MAQAAMFSVAGKLLITIASPVFKEAYKRIESIRGAKDDLAHLEKTIQALEAVLLDAEKRQEDSAAVKIWVKRVRDVLCDAEDVFLQIATVDLVKKQRGEKLIKKVQTYFSPSLNPFFSKKYIADQVKAIREELGRIDGDMKVFNFVSRSCGGEKEFSREGRETGAYVNPNRVIGRDDDKKAILRFLLDESDSQQDVSIIAIVGIGGMGKTTLAQLVVCEEDVIKKFGKPWWAYISNEPRKKQVLATILQSMGGGRDHQNSTMSQLQDQIRECVSRRGKYLLVLDDLWDDNLDRCSDLRDLLSSSDARGSKIIVTTKSLSVAEAITAEVHPLKGLSEDEKWDLFKMVAITPKREKDPRWMRLGREIAKMCADVPLAVGNVAGLLRKKTTLQEWESLKNDELSKLRLSKDAAIATLKLSYDHLEPSLKHCFAYYSVFPKGNIIDKRKLIYLWIAQGYIVDEYEGHGYVTELLGIYFLDPAYGPHSSYYKMHDLVHDLAQLVAGDGVSTLPEKLDQCTDAVRHLCIDRVRDTWEFPPVLLNANRLRSCLFRGYGIIKPLILDQQLVKFMFLRALDLSHLCIREVPDRIGELLNLRYLNLSHNGFNSLTGSFTELLNLITLDISFCECLEVLPNDFRRLISLRHLIADGCTSLKHMPPGFREMTEMQRLDYFIVDDATSSGKGNGPDALAQMKKLRGSVRIQFSKEEDGWVEDALVSGFSGLSVSIEELVLSDYPGMRIQSLPTNLVVLELSGCKKLIHLPPLELFRYLERLKLNELDELEYVEGDGCSGGGVQGFTTAAGSSSSCLRVLELESLPKLKGWSRRDQPLTLRLGEALASLVYLHVEKCDTLKELCFPPANVLEALAIRSCNGLEIDDEEEKRAVDWRSLPKLRRLHLFGLPGLESLEGQTLNSLEDLSISFCSQLKSVSFTLKDLNALSGLQNPGCGALEFRSEDLTSLATVKIIYCRSLKNIYMSSANSLLEKLAIEHCPELLLLKNPMCLDWVSLRNLQKLILEGFPELESFSVEALTLLRTLSICKCRRLKKLCLRSKNRSVLERLWIEDCPELELWEEEEQRGMDLDFLSNLTKLSLSLLPQLECFQGEGFTSLRHLSLYECIHLKSVKLPPRHLNVIEELEFGYCGDMELWKEETRGVDWNSLPNLRSLDINSMPIPHRLPDCLQQRIDNCKLCITDRGHRNAWPWNNFYQC